MSEPFKMPSTDWLMALFERMGKTECRGERDFVDVCTAAVETACPERTSNACPKRVLAFERSMRQDEATSLRLQAMGVPLFAAELLGGEYKRNEPLVFVEEFMDANPRVYSAVIAGDTGLGKTVAACYGLTRQNGKFMRAGRMAQKRRDDEWLDEHAKAPLLVVDDLGTEPLDSFDSFASALNELFTTRLDSRLRTILTTNLSMPDLRERYGERFYDRLKDGWVFGVSGESMRGRK